MTLSTAKFIDFGGAGVGNVTLTYSGTGYALTISGQITGLQSFKIHDLRIVGGTKTPGRHGILEQSIAPSGYYNNIYISNFDCGFRILNTNTRFISQIRIYDCNDGMRFESGGVTAPSHIYIHDAYVDWCSTTGIHMGADNKDNFSMNFTNGAVEFCGVGIQVSGNGRNLAFEDLNMESQSTVDIYLKGFSADFPHTNVSFRNVRAFGAGRLANMIKVEYVDNLYLENVYSYNHTGSMILLNVDTTSTNMTIVNPYIQTTPYLIDQATLLTRAGARLCGTVVKGRSIGTIVYLGTSGLVAGDVVTLQTSAGRYATTTLQNQANAGVVLFPSAGAEKPGVIAIDGLAQVNVKGPTSLGDTLTTSTTPKKAQVANTQSDPKVVIGYCQEAINAAGLVYARILK